MNKVAVFLSVFVLSAAVLPAQESSLDAATIAAMESLYGPGKDDDNFPYAELALVTEMALSMEGLWELGRDMRLGSGIHGAWSPSDWVYFAADVQGLYVGGPVAYLNAPGLFSQAELMVPLFHWKQNYVDEYGSFVLCEDSLLGPELGASLEWHGWKDLWDSDFDGPWGSRRWFTHEGSATDFRIWAGLSFMTISPWLTDPDLGSRFRASARFIYGNASAQDTITFESDGSTEDSSFSAPAEMGGILRAEAMFGFFGMGVEMGYYRGFHFAISMSPGWVF